MIPISLSQLIDELNRLDSHYSYSIQGRRIVLKPTGPHQSPLTINFRDSPGPYPEMAEELLLRLKDLQNPPVAASFTPTSGETK